MSDIAIVFALLAVLLAFLAVGFFLWQKRFWTQARNRSATAPRTPEEGIGNNTEESTKNWSPPKSA